jgi:hypothetical protein
MPEDFSKEQRAQIKEEKEFLELMQRLAKHQDFITYSNHLSKRASDIGNALLDPLDGNVNATYVQEYQKGTVKGLVLASTLPFVTVSAAADTAATETAEGETE